MILRLLSLVVLLGPLATSMSSAQAVRAGDWELAPAPSSTTSGVLGAGFSPSFRPVTEGGADIPRVYPCKFKSLVRTRFEVAKEQVTTQVKLNAQVSWLVGSVSTSAAQETRYYTVTAYKVCRVDVLDKEGQAGASENAVFTATEVWYGWRYSMVFMGSKSSLTVAAQTMLYGANISADGSIENSEIKVKMEAAGLELIDGVSISIPTEETVASMFRQATEPEPIFVKYECVRPFNTATYEWESGSKIPYPKGGTIGCVTRGVAMEPCDWWYYEGGGIKVLRVADGSPLDQSGVKAGDRIIAVNGEELKKDTRMTQFYSALDKSFVGDDFVLSIVRNNDNDNDGAKDYPVKVVQRTPYGVRGARLGIRHRDDLTVQSVQPGSPAYFAQEPKLLAGDRIVSANGEPVDSRAALQRILDKASMWDFVLLEFIREGTEYTLPLAIAPAKRLEYLTYGKDLGFGSVRVVGKNVKVESVKPDLAVSKYLTKGDILISVNGVAIESSADLVGQIKELAVEDLVTIVFQRGEKKFKFSCKVEMK